MAAAGSTTRKQNFSAKRQAILEVIRSAKCHPNAEWVYQQLKTKFPTLSLGTVYRNIAQFKEDGLIISVGVVDGHERFDAITHPHGHFICKACGQITDVLDDHVAPDMIAAVARECSVEIESHELTFYGLCPNCRDKAAEG